MTTRSTAAPFAGRYQLVEEVGAGGMGTVYRAIDLAARAPVAVKIVRIADPGDEARFAREAAALGGVSHPAIVRYLGHGCERGVHYLVMDWLDGQTLADHVADVGISPAETLAVAARVAAGLAEVHARGLVHRDIKPGNLMLVDGDPARVTILDFGVARPTATQAVVTHTGRTVGTPGYMSPEQFRGAGHVDHRTDVYALGCVLFFLLCGRAPFLAKSPADLIADHLTRPAPAASSMIAAIAPAVDAIVARCLAKSADRRFQTMHELVAAIDEVEAPAPSALAIGTRATVAPRRSRLWLAIVCAIVFGGATIAAVAHELQR